MKSSYAHPGVHRVFLAAAVLGLCLASVSTWSQDNETIEFKGANSTVTTEFTVQAPWILDWRIYTDFPQSMSVEIALLNANTGMHDGQVLQTKQIGNGVKLFEQSGAYKLRIDSNLARWHLLIRELTAEEAKQYTPKQNEGVLGNQWFRTRRD